MLPVVNDYAFAADFDDFVFIPGRILFIQCIPGVVDDVQEDALQLVRIHNDAGKGRIEIEIQLDPVDANLILAQLQDRGENIVGIVHGFFGIVVARKTQKILDDSTASFGL
jgi:hypothetical protein